MSVLWTLAKYADLVILPVALIVFVIAIPNGIPAVGSRLSSFQQRYLQFNLQTLFWLITLVGILFGIGRLTGINLLLLIFVWTFALLYSCGPWTALLIATSTRLWHPNRERLAGGLALLALLALPFLVATMASIIYGDDTLHRLSRFACILWTTQIVLYLLLRPLLLPLDDSRSETGS
ncbi:MAG: hypothetical protein SFU86_12815 [Pirellulaceae bacterium]|nr:hypothetical protein [Pirellulaceae bacterium]